MLGKNKVVRPAVETASGQIPDLLSVMSLAREDRVRNEAAIRRLCHSVYLGDHSTLCRVLGRYKMYVDSRDVGIAPHLMLDGYWEMWVTEVLVALVREGMIVADIGANIGYFSILLAELVGSTGRVHAFEPNACMTNLLQRSLSVNGFSDRVHIHSVALGAENDSMTALVIPPGDPKNAYTLPLAEASPGAETVPLARLDSKPDWSAIELAKIDVEGAEQMIWAGAQGLLDNGKLKTVVLEFTAARYSDPAAFLQNLLVPGFTLDYVDLRDGIVGITPAEVMERDPHTDIMLVLRR